MEQRTMTKRVKNGLTMLLLFVSLFMLRGMVSAQHNKFNEPMNVKFRSRVLLDLGYTEAQGYEGRLYPMVSDLRLGVKVQQQCWAFKIDVGLAGSDISIKDLTFDYLMPQSTLTLGNAYEPFSMDMITSSVDMRFNTSASISQTIAGGRRMGLTYHVHPRSYYGAIGVYTENGIGKLFEPQGSSSGVAVTTRHAYRYRGYDGGLVQVGGACSFRTTDNAKRSMGISSTGFSSMTGLALVDATVDSARYVIKSCAEVLVMQGRVMVQGEYLRMEVMRDGGVGKYVAQGGYGQLSLLLGKSVYGYDNALAVPVRPGAGGVEIVGRVDYVDANYGMWRGGSCTDLSLGLNYFFHKHFAVKLNVNYTLLGGGGGMEEMGDFVTSVVRFQFCI
ncbi:MAG: porin [Marinifilaceae bacterium]